MQDLTIGAGLASIVGPREGWRSREPYTEAEAAAYAEGKAMPLEQAIAYVLSTEGAPA